MRLCQGSLAVVFCLLAGCILSASTVGKVFNKWKSSAWGGGTEESNGENNEELEFTLRGTETAATGDNEEKEGAFLDDVKKAMMAVEQGTTPSSTTATTMRLGGPIYDGTTTNAHVHTLTGSDNDNSIDQPPVILATADDEEEESLNNNIDHDGIDSHHRMDIYDDFGGQIAQKAYPSFVSSAPPNPESDFCGGVVVHEDIAVSAAHCRVAFPDKSKVTVGAKEFRPGFTDPVAGDPGLTRFVERTLPHPDFSRAKKPYRYDIMCICLTQAVPEANVGKFDVTPNPILTTGTPYTTVGHGLTRLSINANAAPQPSLKLREIKVDGVNDAKCKLAFPLYDKNIQVCTGDGPAAGDSGGPLFNGDDVAIGVVSGGTCTQIYTRFSPGPQGIHEWIKKDCICKFSRNPPDYCGKIKSGKASGEPHIMTWSGHKFDYQGECDLVMLQSSQFDSGLGLTLHIRTKIEHAYNYIASAALKIGNDILEFQSKGVYYLNGEEEADLSNHTIAGFPIIYSVREKRRHILGVHLGLGQRIMFREYKDIVSVSVEKGVWDDFSDSTGLMGSFVTGSMLARDGTTVMDHDPDAFGQEWQVRPGAEPMLFQTHRAPQYPQRCILPQTTTESSRRRLGVLPVSQADAEKACAHVENKEDCIFDVMATGDLEMALADAYSKDGI